MITPSLLFPLLININKQVQLQGPGQSISMTAKQTELYMYFQNKAHHYQNIQTARHKVQDRLNPTINHTIDYASRLKQNRGLPQNKRYQIEVENGHMTHRIASIGSTSRKEVEVNGNYSRYNHFQRKFRLNKWAQSQEQRLRQIKNQKIQAKIASMKPQVGSRKFWEDDYQQKTSLKKKKKGNSSRGSLHLQQKPFMPQAYLDFLNMIHANENNRNNKDMTHSRSSKGEKQTIAIQKLFILPNLTTKKTLKMKNSQLSLSSSEVSLDRKQQVPLQK